MTTLHLLLSANISAWQDCAGVCRRNDEVLLADAGVGLLTQPEVVARLLDATGPAQLSALQADVSARGLEACSSALRVSLLGDAGWVGKVCSHARVLSWI
jgi:sulfur relay protein TusB/DsrH